MRWPYDAALASSDWILLKTVLMLFETFGIIAPAATATNPAIRAYSMRSWAWSSLQNVDNVCFMRSPSRAQRWPDVPKVTGWLEIMNRQEHLGMGWEEHRAEECVPGK